MFVTREAGLEQNKRQTIDDHLCIRKHEDIHRWIGGGQGTSVCSKHEAKYADSDFRC